ncbi:hypothetical protein [Bacteroides heparinolyticus]|uniref:hypothetical protein n=1 Tax=Prevotella heparinolytica TaxID=28113 RepID=UPI0035A19334
MKKVSKKLELNKRIVANLDQVRGGEDDPNKGMPTKGIICTITIGITLSDLIKDRLCCTDLCASKNGTCPSQLPPCTTFSAQKCG